MDASSKIKIKAQEQGHATFDSLFTTLFDVQGFIKWANIL
jgi:hypothetical protein